MLASFSHTEHRLYMVYTICLLDLLHLYRKSLLYGNQLIHDMFSSAVLYEGHAQIQVMKLDVRNYDSALIHRTITS